VPDQSHPDSLDYRLRPHDVNIRIMVDLPKMLRDQGVDLLDCYCLELILSTCRDRGVRKADAVTHWFSLVGV
jgi:hypothetical protein